MSEERVSATRRVGASVEAVWAVLVDPASHGSIDGTGWVTDAVDVVPISAEGQVFRMAMYHPDHPDGHYETSNQVIAFEPLRAVAWRTGYVDEATGRLEFGGWWWRYDLVAVGDGECDVTLGYDWSDVGPEVREYLTFPVFAPGHLEESLEHLEGLVG